MFEKNFKWFKGEVRGYLVTGDSLDVRATLTPEQLEELRKEFDVEYSEISKSAVFTKKA